MTYSVAGESGSHGAKSCIIACVPGCIRTGINSSCSEAQQGTGECVCIKIKLMSLCCNKTDLCLHQVYFLIYQIQSELVSWSYCILSGIVLKPIKDSQMAMVKTARAGLKISPLLLTLHLYTDLDI